jgi:hypothetical protein
LLEGIEVDGFIVFLAGSPAAVKDPDPAGDALHLALASFHKCEFLVTWNCRHLANANKFGHIRRVNTLLGLMIPALVTPLGLLGADDDTETERSGNRRSTSSTP